VTAGAQAPVDVAIVGFGPVGATLAGLLGVRGVNTLVIDREWDVFQLPRAAHIDHTGLRTLQELGLLDELLPTMVSNAGLDFVTASGELLMQVPSSQTSSSGIPPSMYFHQPDLDRRVRAAVSALPSVEIRLGTQVTDVRAGTDQAVLTYVDPAGAVAEVEASWVIGCDGSSSLMRESSGLELDDLGFEERWLVVDLLLRSGADPLGASAVCRCDPARPTYSIPMPERRHRFEFMLMAGGDPAGMLDREQVLALVAPWLDLDGVSIERSAVYTFHGLVAPQWRRGRVLLAGDAAHQMPPFLGQGMCSGIRDAANLAWKLNQVLRFGAPEKLIDSYSAERSVHVRSIVEAAVAYGRVICTVDPAEAAERDRRMLADPAPVTQRMPFALPALMSGELVLEGGGDLFVQPRVDGGARLDDLIGSRFAVIARDQAQLGQAGRWWQEEADAFVATLGQLGEHVPAVQRWLDSHAADVVVIRPDRYVLWAGRDLGAATDRVADLLVGNVLQVNAAQRPELAEIRDGIGG
jgi:2-polyprenyl-6-methoxyphenol hydroxylase-like FAD-dependent oxidoreductase